MFSPIKRGAKKSMRMKCEEKECILKRRKEGDETKQKSTHWAIFKFFFHFPPFPLFSFFSSSSFFQFRPVIPFPPFALFRQGFICVTGQALNSSSRFPPFNPFPLYFLFPSFITLLFSFCFTSSGFNFRYTWLPARFFSPFLPLLPFSSFSYFSFILTLFPFNYFSL